MRRFRAYRGTITMSRAADACTFNGSAHRDATDGDAALQRLLALGFRLEEVRRPLSAALAADEPDPVAYVLGVLIR